MANTAADLFEKLLKLTFDPATATKNVLKRIGVLIDLAGDLGRDDGTAQALAWCDELSKRKLTDQQASLLKLPPIDENLRGEIPRDINAIMFQYA